MSARIPPPVQSTCVPALIHSARRVANPEKMTKMQEIIDNIEKDIYSDEGFDFEKVHSIMEYINWGQIFDNGKTHIPSVDELKKTARKVLGLALKHDGDDFIAIGISFTINKVTLATCSGIIIFFKIGIRHHWT